MKAQKMLSRLQLILLWVTALLGLVLLIDTVKTVVHMALCLVTFVVLVLAGSAWQKTAARVVARVLCLLTPVVFAGLLCVYIGFYVQAVQGGGTVALSDQPLTILAVVGTPLFCWQLPAVAAVAGKGGGYDKWVLRVIHTLQLALTLYVCFGTPAEYIPWHWEAAALRYIWVAVAVIGYGLSWFPTAQKEKGGA